MCHAFMAYNCRRRRVLCDMRLPNRSLVRSVVRSHSRTVNVFVFNLCVNSMCVHACVHAYAFSAGRIRVKWDFNYARDRWATMGPAGATATKMCYMKYLEWWRRLDGLVLAFMSIDAVV